MRPRSRLFKSRLASLAVAAATASGLACGEDQPPLVPHPGRDSLTVIQTLAPPLPNRTEATPFHILDDGRMYGSSRAPSIWHERATYWAPSGSAAQDMGIVGNPDRGPGTLASAVNAAGTVVGYTWLGGQAFHTDNGSRAFRVDPGQPPTFLQGLSQHPSYALDINDHGVVVGCAWKPGALPGYPHLLRAVRWAADGSVTELGTFGGPHSCAFGINNDGWVVGRAGVSAIGAEHAFLWREGSGMVDLGTLGGSNSRAWALNSAGQIVGESTTGKPGDMPHAFIWTPAGGMTQLPTLPGGHYAVAEDIDDHGTVVGYGWSEDDEAEHAIMWPKGGGIVDLSRAAEGAYALVVRSRATAISPGGLIAGTRTVSGVASAARWRVKR